MEKKWKAENERIMREHPVLSPAEPESAPSADSDAGPVMVEQPTVVPAAPVEAADRESPELQNKAPS